MKPNRHSAAAPDSAATPSPALNRRLWLGGAAAAAALSAGRALAADDDAPHKIVYQLNQADPAYQEAILNSIGAMLKKYVDDISIVVVVWGAGIHLLAKKPQRPVAPALRQRVQGMAQSYGVRFIACGNTMHTIGWTAADMLDFAQVEEVGAASIMELQEKGYAYLAW
jgi:uncharacterized protein